MGRRTDKITGGVVVGLDADNWAGNYTDVLRELVYDVLKEGSNAHPADEFVRHASVFMQQFPWIPDFQVYSDLYEEFALEQKVRDPDFKFRFNQSFETFKASLQECIAYVVATVTSMQMPK